MGMMCMTIAIIVCGLLSALVIVACCKVSGDCARQEEQEDPCSWCYVEEMNDGN
jgi:hypothetical protein